MNKVIQTGYLATTPRQTPQRDKDGNIILDEYGYEVPIEKSPFAFILYNREYNQFYRRMKPNYHPCIAWAGVGKAIIDNFELGDRIMVEGIMKTDWTTSPEKKRVPQYRIQVHRFEHEVKIPVIEESCMREAQDINYEVYFDDKDYKEGRIKTLNEKSKTAEDKSSVIEDIFG